MKQPISRFQLDTEATQVIKNQLTQPASENTVAAMVAAVDARLVAEHGPFEVGEDGETYPADGSPNALQGFRCAWEGQE